MQKIPTLFVRDPQTRLVTPEITPGCEWVAQGHGTASRKRDGMCILIYDGNFWRRHRGAVTPAWRELRGRFRQWIGDNLEATSPQTTGGWRVIDWRDRAREPVYYRSLSPAWNSYTQRAGFGYANTNGTYELCAPGINGNSEEVRAPTLWRHGVDEPKRGAPRTYAELATYLYDHNYEGLVWKHPDNVRYAKIKLNDFGLLRTAQQRRLTSRGLPIPPQVFPQRRPEPVTPAQEVTNFPQQAAAARTPQMWNQWLDAYSDALRTTRWEPIDPETQAAFGGSMRHVMIDDIERDPPPAPRLTEAMLNAVVGGMIPDDEVATDDVFVESDEVEEEE